MDQHEIETLIKNIDDRTSRIEQILPTLATKEEMREEGERTRRHFNVVADGLKEDIKVIADGHKALGDRITNLGRDIKSVIANHEHRITALEADSSKRR